MACTAEEDRDAEGKLSSTQSTGTPASPVRLAELTPSVTLSNEFMPEADGDALSDGASQTMTSRASVQEKLSRSEALAKEVKHRLNRNSTVESWVAADFPKYAKLVQSELRERLASTTDLAKLLEDQMDAVDRVVSEVGDSMMHLRRAYRQKWAPLCVCRRRIEIRAERPPHEEDRDKWQDSLELEMDVLKEARQELSVRMQASNATLPPLEAVKTEMLEDLHKKRHSYRIDHLCLLDGSTPQRSLKADLSVSRPSLCGHEVMSTGQSSVGGTPRSCSGDAAAARQLRVQGLVARAASLVEEARRELVANTQCIAATENECSRATSLTTFWMNRHLAELAAQKKPIEAKIVETDDLIQQTRVSAAKLVRKLKQSDAPVQTLNRQFSLRQQRVEDQQVRDRVQEKMEEHLDVVRKNSQALASQKDETVDLVKALRETKRELQEALAHKAATLRVEMACAKVTHKAAVSYYLADAAGRRGSCTQNGAVETTDMEDEAEGSMAMSCSQGKVGVGTSGAAAGGDAGAGAGVSSPRRGASFSRRSSVVAAGGGFAVGGGARGGGSARGGGNGSSRVRPSSSSPPPLRVGVRADDRASLRSCSSRPCVARPGG